MTNCAGFAPVSRPDARVLIVGTLPGAESLRRQEYYAKSQNAFWRILGELIGAGPDLPYQQRLQTIKSAGLALWDVCASAHREGSLDANIRELETNDFGRYFPAHPHIGVICFNGQTAGKLFERFVIPDLTAEARKIPRKILPSTSPAHASMPFAQKLESWRCALMPTAAGAR
jgi:hypoxanthine-DNA glycosylase